MELIQIPRYFVWNETSDVFTDLRKFLTLSEGLCRERHLSDNRSAPVTVLTQLAHVHKLPIVELQRCFYALRDAAFAYRRPVYQQKGKDVLFSDADLVVWRKDKKQFKTLIKQHTTLMLHLKDYQQRCWHSKGKAKQAASLVEAAQLSVPYHVDNMVEYNARMHAIKGLKKDLAFRLKNHVKNISFYQKLQEKEVFLRKEIKEYNDKLAREIKSCIRRRIEDALENLRSACDPQTYSVDLDCDRISRRLYEIASKTYVFKLPPADVSGPEFNEAITKPCMEPSLYSYGHNDSKYASPNYFGTVIENSEPVLDHDLKLKKGDTVKLKLVSHDNKVGFGWTRHSKMFSLKKWGFFQISDVQLYPENKASD